MSQGFFYYFFILSIWFIYIFSNNQLMKKFKKGTIKREQIIFLEIPFGLFFYYFFIKIIFEVLTLSLERIFYLFGLEGSSSFLVSYNAFYIRENNINHYLTFFLQGIGLVFSLSAVLFFVYLVFFEKSFPSCSSLGKGEKLSGIYNYLRHPSYMVFFLLLFGTSLFLTNIVLFSIAIFININLYYLYSLEEKNIAENSLYYREYLKKSRMFLPFSFKRKNRSC